MRLTRLFFLTAISCPLLFTNVALAQGEGDASEDDFEDEYEIVDESGEAIDEEIPEEPTEEAPAKAPKAGKAALWGVVRDTQYKEPVIEAQVTVLGVDKTVLTDLNGRFRVELPPGKYSIRVQYEAHKTQRFDGIELKAGGVQRLNVNLVPDEEAVETFEVVVEADKSSLAGLALKRKRSAAAGDAIGRAEISKTGDSNAAQASQRVVGATIEGGRFVFVRGLGNRYTNSRLNGGLLPSPEPDQAAVPLDLFPALTLEYVNIAKTFTPDMPGDFAGGSVEIVTRDVPTELLFKASASVGYNSQTTFRTMPSQRGSDTDWLGFDSGLRALPGSIPKYKLARGVEKPNGDFISPEELEAHGEELNTYMSSTDKVAPVNHSFSVVGGNGWKIDEDQKIGFITSLNYSHNYQRRIGRFRVFEVDPNRPNGVNIIQDLERFNEGNETVSWGAFGTLVYELNPKNKFKLVAFRSQLADITTQRIDGYYSNLPAQLRLTHLEFVSRALNVVQLVGDHEFDDLNHGQLTWNAGYSVAQRDQPDTRDIVYQFNESSNRYFYRDGGESGRHFFAEQSERAMSGGLDWKQPLTDNPDETYLKVGGFMAIKRRDFEARRFALRQSRVPRPAAEDQVLYECPEGGYTESCPDRLFVNDNIGAPRNLLAVEEGTIASDSYTADLDVLAAYVMTDVNVTDDLRVIVGERIEHTRQNIKPTDQLGTGEDIEGADLKELSLLPSAGLIYNATEKAKLRSSVSRTLARPQLRELAPFAFSDYFAARPVSGNPDLKLTSITNVDLRFEYFPALSEVLAVSIFYKRFQDPIETVVIPAAEGGQIGFRNAKGANLIGTELEARVGMHHFSDALEDLSLVTNLTLTRSRIEVQQTGDNFQTNVSRPMFNQAPWIYNVAVDYSNDDIDLRSRALLNVVGRRLVAVGTFGLDDAYQHPAPTLDLVVTKGIVKEPNISVQFTGGNLLNPDQVRTLGTDRSKKALTTARWRDGVDLQLGMSLTL